MINTYRRVHGGTAGSVVPPPQQQAHILQHSSVHILGLQLNYDGGNTLVLPLNENDNGGSEKKLDNVFSALLALQRELH